MINIQDVCAAHFAYICSGLLPFSSPLGQASDTAAYGLLGLDSNDGIKNLRRIQSTSTSLTLSLSHTTHLCASRSIIAFRMTEVMEWSTCREGDSKEVKEGEVPATSLKRSLGGLFGLIGTTDTSSSSSAAAAGSGVGVGAQSASALRSFQMRAALSPIKVQWALLLADLGMLKGASAYAKDAKYIAEGALHALSLTRQNNMNNMNNNNNYNNNSNSYNNAGQGYGNQKQGTVKHSKAEQCISAIVVHLFFFYTLFTLLRRTYYFFHTIFLMVDFNSCRQFISERGRGSNRPCPCPPLRQRGRGHAIRSYPGNHCCKSPIYQKTRISC